MLEERLQDERLSDPKETMPSGSPEYMQMIVEKGITHFHTLAGAADGTILQITPQGYHALSEVTKDDPWAACKVVMGYVRERKAALQASRASGQPLLVGAAEIYKTASYEGPFFPDIEYDREEIE